VGVKAKWWDDVISTDLAPYYLTSDKAKKDDGKLNSKGIPRSSPGGRKGTYIWGDRVRILEHDGNARRVSGRGKEYWLHKRHLGGNPLLEVYIIDVGQGDGLLVVTPDGHHIMVDGGNTRSFQNGGKNAADFVDWKFAKDYCSFADRNNPAKTKIELDAMVATHNDIDHFGGLSDLLDLEDPKNKAELDASGVSVEALYHAGLSWWWHPTKQNKRTLGDTISGFYTKLLNGRNSAVAATRNIGAPDLDTLSGAWGAFIKAATKTKKVNNRATKITRISTKTHKHLPGFGPSDNSDCIIRVLGPIESETNDQPSLKQLSGGNSKNTNGHSVILRLDYGDRRILLTGDLNTASQNHIMETFGTDFVPEFMSDVTKGCHHGSHDVSYSFLEGIRPVATIISSGDAETHDHPRPNIVAASAITGRKLIEKDRLKAPLVYMTEVARSVTIKSIGFMNEYRNPQPEYEKDKPTGAKQKHNTEDEMSRFRLFLGSSQSRPNMWPRLDNAKAVSGLRYGLVNVRTDGKRLFFAQKEESGGDWAIHTLSDAEIRKAK